METVLFVVHIMVVLALIVIVLLQRSEGGALGIGGGGGGGGMSSRATGDIMTKITTVLALAFFLTSISIALLAQTSDSANDILDRIQDSTSQGGGSGSEGGVLDALDGSLEPSVPTEPAVPQVPTGN
jgi:preprotein translocase subunit SecG